MGYRIGLDIGSTSVGWAVVEDDKYGNPIKILDLGVRIFGTAKLPINGISSSEERSLKRRSRRQNRRKVHRISRVKKLLVDKNILSFSELDRLYLDNNFNIYKLRVDAIDNEVSKFELSALLINFVKKRGYKSNSKCESLNQNSGKVLSSIEENRKLIKEKGYRTVGEMYLRDDKFKYKLEDGTFLIDENGNKIIKIRNDIGNYTSVVDREELLKEIKLILDVQREYNKNITEEFINEYLDIFTSQRNFDEGPAYPSKYSGNMIEKMIGKCSFEKDEMRAAKSTYSFEVFKMLQDLDKIRIIKINKKREILNCYNIKDSRGLKKEEKEIIFREFNYASKLSYFKIRKIINLPYNYIFNTVKYDLYNMSMQNDIESLIDNAELDKEAFLCEMESFHILRKVLDKYELNYIYKLDEDILDYIFTILTVYKSDEKRKEYLLKTCLSEDIINLLLNLSFSNFSHLSIKAIRKIIMLLNDGLSYDLAINKLYNNFSGKLEESKNKKISLKDLENITNPIVRRGVSQSIKVLNAIVRKYGRPEIINIELANKFPKNYNKRSNIRKNKLEKKLEIIKEIKVTFKKEIITETDILKYKLWLDQDRICIYSGKEILPNELFTDNIVIDYIIPYSKTFDDSYNNKVLVRNIEAKKKSEKLPIEYIKSSKKGVRDYKKRVFMYCKNKEKINNLLTDKITIKDEIECRERNLKDTQFITRNVLSLIKNNLVLQKNEYINNDRMVVALNGKITYNIRNFFDLKKSRDSDIHHAIDAVIIAITSSEIISEILSNNTLSNNNINKYISVKYFKDKLNEIINKNFENIGLIAKNSIFVSRMPKRNVTGMAHRDTISGVNNKGNIIVKRPITKLKLDKNNEIHGYYNKKDDKLLYEALKNRLIEFNGDAKLAFDKPFFKPKSNGERGPIVKKVKLEIKSTSNVNLNKIGGVAKNGDCIRIDIFYIENEGYYFVPIYVSDTIKTKLPNKACISKTLQNKWRKVEDSEFLFSLYPGDLIYIKSNTGINLSTISGEKIVVDEMYGYYIKCGINSNSIAISTHDRMYFQLSLGIRNLSVIKKFQVDILGNCTEVKLPEKRMSFNIKKYNSHAL